MKSSGPACYSGLMMGWAESRENEKEVAKKVSVVTTKSASALIRRSSLQEIVLKTTPPNIFLFNFDARDPSGCGSTPDSGRLENRPGPTKTVRVRSPTRKSLV